MPGGTTTAALDRAVRRYRDTDLAFVDRYVPRHGFIVDLGCGHGLFANLLVESSAGRRVLGIDVDERKIAVARATVDDRESIRFERGDIVHEPLPRCDAVTIVDVLYLLPPGDQAEVLRKAAAALPENAPLVVKAHERAASPRFALTYAQELVATSIGLTRGRRGRFHFLSRDEAIPMFERAGFLVDVIEMPGRPYSDVVYLARKAPATR